MEGTTMLLMSPGIGRRSLARALAAGLAAGVFVGCCKALSLPESRPLVPGAAAHGATDVWFGSLWQAALLMLNGVLWLAPNKGLLSRRPAAIYHARFYALFYALQLTLYYCLLARVDAAYCLNAALQVGCLTIIRFDVTQPRMRQSVATLCLSSSCLGFTRSFNLTSHTTRL
jgi:hypothetical protein